MGIALQLYSVREDCAKDFDGTLKRVAEMGYEGVEFAGYYGRSVENLRGILDDLGLKVAGTHIGIDSLLGEEYEKTVEFNRTLGNRFLIVPGLPAEMLSSKPKCLETASLFNDIAEKLRKEGMRIGYHNHMMEFKTVNGRAYGTCSSAPRTQTW